MIAALDVSYQVQSGSEIGRCAVVAFDHWQSTQSTIELSVTVDNVSPYVPGRFFERELPCLIAGLAELAQGFQDGDLECVLVDGNVRLDARSRAGIGLLLYRHLGESVPVVGVAKSPFRGLDAVEVLRGTSSKPLYVTAAGINELNAACLVRSMAGMFRIPTLIRRADQLTRSP